MRALIGLLVLGCLFVMAASWQNRTTAELQSRRSLRYAAPADAANADTAGWSRLILGRPSGSEPLPIPEPPPSLRPGSSMDFLDGSATYRGGEEGSAGVASRSAVDPSSIRPVGVEATVAPRYARDFEYIVRPNDSLGEICRKHYDERPLHKLVEAVALYNDLKSPNAIRVGKTILLPDAAVLFPDR
ncbi:LysM peptidoglycan-binding domain-containing protein [Planctomycetes bacterium Poly30]